MENNQHTQTAQIEIPNQLVSSMIEGAFSYGSTYWIRKINPKMPVEGKFYEVLNQCLNENLSFEIEIFDKESDDVWTFKSENIPNGLNIMSSKYQRHFFDMLCENDDAITADVFFQCCLFNDIVFG